MIMSSIPSFLPVTWKSHEFHTHFQLVLTSSGAYVNKEYTQKSENIYQVSVSPNKSQQGGSVVRLLTTASRVTAQESSA